MSSFNISLVNTCFSTTATDSLLDAALRQNVVLEHSCKTGRCGVCKTKVVSGHTQVIQEETSLSEADIADGYILTCCRSATNDVVLGAEALNFLSGIKTKTLPCRIDVLHKLSHDVLQVTLRLPPNQPLRYLAGQYIDLIAKDIRRSYSVANTERDDNKLILEIRCVEQGQMSNYLFHHAKVNDLLRLEGPKGTFCLRENAKTPLFIATGTGIAPIKAMIESLPTDQPITVYWGGRVAEDIYWKAIPDNVKLIPVLSRADDDWSGKRGYVQQAVIADDIDLSTVVVYACGSESMIRDAKALFIQAGLSEKDFYSDAFVSSS